MIEIELSTQENKEQENYADALKNTHGAAEPKTVIIRFHGTLSRNDITNLQQKLNLNTKGFVVRPPLRSEAISKSGVTYYDENDATIAEEVLEQANQFFEAHGCPLGTTKSFDKQKEKMGTIYLDIVLNC